MSLYVFLSSEILLSKCFLFLLLFLCYPYFDTFLSTWYLWYFEYVILSNTFIRLNFICKIQLAQKRKKFVDEMSIRIEQKSNELTNLTNEFSNKEEKLKQEIKTLQVCELADCFYKLNSN